MERAKQSATREPDRDRTLALTFRDPVTYFSPPARCALAEQPQALWASAVVLWRGGGRPTGQQSKHPYQPLTRRAMAGSAALLWQGTRAAPRRQVPNPTLCVGRRVTAPPACVQSSGSASQQVVLHRRWPNPETCMPRTQQTPKVLRKHARLSQPKTLKKPLHRPGPVAHSVQNQAPSAQFPGRCA